MTFLTKVPVFDADDLAGMYMVPVYDTESEIIDEVMRAGIAGIAGPEAAILCYLDDNGKYRGEMRVEGETRAVCDVDSLDVLAKWLSQYSHHCKR